MTRMHHVAAATLLVLASCEADPRPPTVVGDGSHGLGGPAGNDQTGSLGELECVDDTPCRTEAEAAIKRLGSPADVTHEFVSASCSQATLNLPGQTVAGPTCVCTLAQGGTVDVGPRGAGCYARGRAGDCLYGDDDFTGCTTDAACGNACDELAVRFAEDAARSIDAELRWAGCVDNSCAAVLKVGGACHPLDGLTDGSSYDCALSDAQIIATHRAEHADQPGGDSQDDDTLYVAGTRGFVQLGVSHEAWGAYDADETFFVSAQFFDAEGEARTFGDTLDPLEGIDDCGVFAAGPVGTGGSVTYFPVDSAELSGESGRYALRASSASHEGFWSYAGDLASARPSYGETYRFSAQGGGLGAPIDVPVTLPADLAVSSLRGVTSVPADDLALQWSGTGEAPLRLHLWVDAKLSDSSTSYAIVCVIKDDGEFVIPGKVLQAAPAGVATATFSRTLRSVETSGEQRLLSVGRVSTTHRFALAPGPVDSTVRDACLAHQVYLVGVYSACGNLYPPNQAETCPDYLSQASGTCASYFDCRTSHVRCTPTGLTSDAVCSCP